MIEEVYVSFECAKLLKDKGFDESCRYYYVNNGNLMFTEEYLHNSEIKYGTYADCVCTAPTQQMAMAWLREVHKIYMDIAPTHSADGFIEFIWQTYDSDYSVTGDCNIFYPTYEEAVETALKYVLKNLI